MEQATTRTKVPVRLGLTVICAGGFMDAYSYLLHGHVHMEYGRIERVVEHPSGTTIVNCCGSYLLDLPDETIGGRGGLFPAEPV